MVFLNAFMITSANGTSGQSDLLPAALVLELWGAIGGFAFWLLAVFVTF